MADNTNTELLISEVHKRPLLWKEKMKNYKNTSITDPLWREVGLEVGISGLLAKKKFKNLKDRWRKEKQKLGQPRSGAEGVITQSNWPFFTSLGFLGSNMPDVPGDDNLLNENIGDANNIHNFETNNSITDDKEEQTSIHGDENLTFSDNEDYPNTTSSSNSNSLKRSGSNINIHSSKHKKIAIVGAKILELEQKKIALLEKKSESKNISPDGNFLLSLLPYIEELPLLDRIKLRQKIQKDVLEAIEKYKEAEAHIIEQDYE